MHIHLEINVFVLGRSIYIFTLKYFPCFLFYDQRFNLYISLAVNFNVFVCRQIRDLHGIVTSLKNYHNNKNFTDFVFPYYMVVSLSKCHVIQPTWAWCTENTNFTIKIMSFVVVVQKLLAVYLVNHTNASVMTW